MDTLEVLQKVASAFATSFASNTTISANFTSQPLPTTTSAFSATVSSLISVFLSFSALRDWIKLIIVGGLIESARRLCFGLWYYTLESVWITASFDEDDSSYDWVMFWLSQHPKWTKARTVEISTRSFGMSSPAVSITGDDTTDPKGSRRLCYLPSLSETYSIWYKGHYMSVTRTQTQSSYYRTKETLQIRILAFNQQFLPNLLLDAKRAYFAAQEGSISIYVSDTSGGWRHLSSRPKRPLRSIVLDPGLKDLLLEDAKDFLDSKSWYADRGIPFRRGYLLYGAPGSGKTSIIHSLAGELGLDVYVIPLSRAGLDDTTLNELISDLPERCIALMEDIDAAFHHGITRDFDDKESDSDTPEEPMKQEKGDSPSPSQSRITLSGLLNALDGVGAQEGRILFATTNRYSALDPALCRPGRMDIHVEFKLASKFQAEELYKCFYLPSESISHDALPCLTEKINMDEDTDSGYGSAKHSPSPNKTELLLEIDELTELVTVSPQTSLLFSGNSHRTRAPNLSRFEIESLARRFAGSIPDREYSMASLQGYLMTYKSRPIEAVQGVGAWVMREREEKSGKLASRGKREV